MTSFNNGCSFVVFTRNVTGKSVLKSIDRKRVSVDAKYSHFAVNYHLLLFDSISLKIASICCLREGISFSTISQMNAKLIRKYS